MIKGISFDFGGLVLVIPPIALGALEQLQERIARFNGATLDAESVATAIDAAWESIKRNYPDMTREKVASLIDVGNMAEVFACVMDVSGVKRRGLAEGEILGN